MVFHLLLRFRRLDLKQIGTPKTQYRNFHLKRFDMTMFHAFFAAAFVILLFRVMKFGKIRKLLNELGTEVSDFVVRAQQLRASLKAARSSNLTPARVDLLMAAEKAANATVLEVGGDRRPAWFGLFRFMTYLDMLFDLAWVFLMLIAAGHFLKLIELDRDLFLSCYGVLILVSLMLPYARDRVFDKCEAYLMTLDLQLNLASIALDTRVSEDQARTYKKLLLASPLVKKYN